MKTVHHNKRLTESRRRIFLVSLATLFLVALIGRRALPVAAQLPTVVRINPASQSINWNTSTTVDIYIDNASNLYGAEVHLTFDPTILAVQDANGGIPGIQIAPGPFLAGPPNVIGTNQSNNGIGTIDFAMALVNPALPVNGSGVLATITFRGIAPGTSPVHFVTTGFLPSYLSDKNAFPLAANFQDGSITVLGPAIGLPPPAEVPEADTLMLLGTGGTSLVTYLMWQWRKRQAHTK